MRKGHKLILVAVVAFGVFVAATNSGRYFEISKQIEIFANLYKEINTYYVDELDPAKLMRTGVDAMLESLDPYTNYISEAEIEGYRFITEGKYNGIGADVKKMDDYITITEIHENSPADKAGLEIGDRILSVDQHSAKGKNRQELDEILKGFPGTTVELQVERPGATSPIDVELVREEVEVKNVPYYGMVSEDIGYAALTTFTRRAGANVHRALDSLRKQNPDLKGFILDLRNNGGGLLNEAVNLSNLFIPKGELVVTTKGKVVDWDRSFNTLRPPSDLDIPVVVLINSRSASASEIVSGVIQDYDRGVLIGQRTFGKGLVQNTREVGYNSQVKLTTAKYYIPSGRCIQAVEYKDGEPLDIPDAKRAKFKTRGGRTVLDGGGIKPDIVTKKRDDISIVHALNKQNLIFRYATQYKLNNPDTPDFDSFQFNAYNDFKAFVKESGFVFESETEKTLNQMIETSKKEDYSEDLTSSLGALKDRVKVTQDRDLDKYKDVIVSLIEEEIVGRYFGASSRIQFGLQHDVDVARAKEILANGTEYKTILGKE